MDLATLVKDDDFTRGLGKLFMEVCGEVHALAPGSPERTTTACSNALMVATVEYHVRCITNDNEKSQELCVELHRELLKVLSPFMAKHTGRPAVCVEMPRPTDRGEAERP